MLAYDTFLMHGAVAAVGERAWMFTAPSGTGKTTHVRLWLEHVPGAYVVNGDKPLIRVGRDVTAFGTPWAGKEGLERNIGVPLSGIVLLERGAANRIEPVSFSEALPELVRQTYRPKERAACEGSLRLLSCLRGRVPIWRLRCNREPEAARLAYQTLSGGV